MSQKRTHAIHCPRCREPLSAELYDAINVREDPPLKEQLLANRLNTVTCTACQLTFRVDAPLIYHDPDHRALIYCQPTAEPLHEAGQRQFREQMSKLSQALPEGLQAPQLHLVFSRTELVERIFLLEAGLNERIIEYIKYLILSKNNAKLDPMQKTLLFNAQDSTPDTLCFVVQDLKSKKLELMIRYDRQTYAALEAMFDRDDQTPTLLELFPGPHISARALLLKEKG